MCDGCLSYRVVNPVTMTKMTDMKLGLCKDHSEIRIHLVGWTDIWFARDQLIKETVIKYTAQYRD